MVTVAVEEGMTIIRVIFVGGKITCEIDYLTMYQITTPCILITELKAAVRGVGIRGAYVGGASKMCGRGLINQFGYNCIEILQQ